MAANRENRRKNYKDPPAEDPYGKIELTQEAKFIGFTELHYHYFRSAECAKQQKYYKELRQLAPNKELS